MLKYSLPFYLAVSVTCSSGIRPCSLGGRGFESHRGQKNDLCGILQLPLLGLKHSLGFVGCFLYHALEFPFSDCSISFPLLYSPSDFYGNYDSRPENQSYQKPNIKNNA